ncbi:transposase [Nonomuraea sp. NPDC050783]|uniref:transposase n=1 Tax=Nonomuraea sp. NPDC050783 TaxID=3154634 RepID=UPI0034655C1E
MLEQGQGLREAVRQLSLGRNTVRQATAWFLRNPAYLAPDEHRQREALTVASPEPAAPRLHVHRFAEMMAHHRRQNLEDWMTAVLRDDLPESHSFVIGLRRDHQDAVTAGLTPPYNSGPVEGHVHHTKMLKRQMHGRAGPGLLHKRILLGDRPRSDYGMCV